MIFECVINISEGHDPAAIAKIADSGGKFVIDIHSDLDHNRSVLTIASHFLDDVYSSTQSVVTTALENLSLEQHSGVHPRLGVVDVVPFVSYDGTNAEPTSETIAAAQSLGEWIDELGTPVFFYDAASSNKTTLPYIRKHAFASLLPSLNVQTPNPQTGAICVGAREPLVAINVILHSRDIAYAQSLAHDIRESSGGIQGVRAIGLDLEKQNAVQVSINIVDPINANAGDVCEEIRERATARNVESDVELVGLVPSFQFEKWSLRFREWSRLTDDCTIEKHLSTQAVL